MCHAHTASLQTAQQRYCHLQDVKSENENILYKNAGNVLLALNSHGLVTLALYTA